MSALPISSAVRVGSVRQYDTLDLKYTANEQPYMPFVYQRKPFDIHLVHVMPGSNTICSSGVLASMRMYRTDGVDRL